DNGGTATSLDNTKPTGTIKTGDWLQLVFTTQETASGSFKGTFSLIDYGPTGVGTATTVLAPVSYTISGLTNLGTASAVSPGFRTATPASFTGHVRFDNFADPVRAAPGALRVGRADSVKEIGTQGADGAPTGGQDNGRADRRGNLLETRRTWSARRFTRSALEAKKVVSAGRPIRLPYRNFPTFRSLPRGSGSRAEEKPAPL
ncbi:MAG TPA: hypothetical protein VKA15_10185, partial [Isosphaeraceae bacterium]|nr:hypothetical protein [Isosphaeraceae bacterium]